MAKKLNTSTSIVDKLKSEGKDSSKTARATMYNSAFGGTYTGSAEQNKQLLSGGSVTSSSTSVRRDERDSASKMKRTRDERDNGKDSLSAAQEAADKRLERLLRNNLTSQRMDIEQSRQSNLSTAQQAQKGQDATLQSGLVRMGGYLGETASGTAAQISLNQRHTEELIEINNEADQALREAERAYQERDIERMNKNLERIAELEKFAYQKEQDIIANNQKWTQIRNQADQFKQEQSLKWSSLAFDKTKFNYQKQQDSKKKGIGQSVMTDISGENVTDFLAREINLSEKGKKKYGELPKVLNINDWKDADMFLQDVNRLYEMNYTTEEVAKMVGRNKQLPASLLPSLQDLIEEVTSY